jgi:uncharacterized protein YggU (UPF0235/DUF167 family)
VAAGTLAVRVTPGAKTSAWAGRLPDGRWKLKIAAPPVDGRANEALERFVAQSLGLPPRAVRVARGAGGRDKVLEVDLEPAALAARLSTIEDGRTE